MVGVLTFLEAGRSLSTPPLPRGVLKKPNTYFLVKGSPQGPPTATNRQPPTAANRRQPSPTANHCSILFL